MHYDVGVDDNDDDLENKRNIASLYAMLSFRKAVGNFLVFFHGYLFLIEITLCMIMIKTFYIKKVCIEHHHFLDQKKKLVSSCNDQGRSQTKIKQCLRWF